ncbi:MAG: winged helix-turn-helix domain-containing protein [Thermoanaerobaculia bacterium]|nr:winged helix-turn-helix domain-containing protein [Thermoanaerobaculia bacterium]
MRPGPEKTRYRFAGFELGGRPLELRRDGEPVPLQPQPMRALALLIQRAGEPVTREELREHLWGREHHLDFEQGINFAIRKIRAALGDDPLQPAFVETLPRHGYRFVSPVEEVPAIPTPAKRNGSARIRPWAGFFGAMAMVLLVMVVVGSREGQLRRPALPLDTRLAVLPFTGASLEPVDEAVQIVLTEELVTHLASRFGERLGIVAMSSTKLYHDSESGVRRIGRELNADYLLQGNVSRTDGGLRITLRLWRVDDQVHVWAEAFETEIATLPGWYEEVAIRVADAVEARVAPVALPPSVPQEPYETYLLGRYLVGQGDEQSIRRGIGMLEEAIRAAPELARAHAALAEAYLKLMPTHPAAEIAAPAEAAARRAVELDDGLAEGHLALAKVVFYFRGDWPTAGREFRRALQLQPRAAEVLHGYGLYLASLGRHDEAIASVRRAVDLDPATVYISSDLAHVYFWAGRYADAAERARQNLIVDPGHLPSHGLLIDALSFLGDVDGAVHQHNILFERLGRDAAVDWPEAQEQALELLESFQERGRHLDVAIADVLVERGDEDLAIAQLVKACEERSDWRVPFIRVNPSFDALRSHPDYADLAPCLAPLTP